MTGKPYQVGNVHKRVRNYLKRRPDRVQDFRAAVENICAGPFPQDNPIRIKHLVADLFCLNRYRLGQERIIYDVDTAARLVHLLDFGSRSDIYKD